MSLKELIWSLAEEIIALHAQGPTYITIAEQLTQFGLSISGSTLRGYISTYRKQKKANTSLSREERVRNLKF